jgi:peptide/nickel transport system substrate-binding protein
VREVGAADRRAPDDGPTEARIRTFLIADVRGYTRFTHERGDEAAGELAARFAAIARESVESHGGALLELRGDEALCVFASTREAIRAAVDLQQRFVKATLDDPGMPLTVGVGLDAGEAVAIEGGYRGTALNVAARLCAQARAGEILATREVTHLARRVDGTSYEERGSVALKGLPDPVVVIRIVPDGEDPIDRLRPFAPAPVAPRRSRRRWAIVGAAVAVLAFAGVASIVLLSAGGAPTVPVGSDSAARLGSDGEARLATALASRSGAIGIGFGSLWVAQPDRGVMVRLDLADGSVTDRSIRVGSAPAGVAVDEDAVWVSNAGDGTVSRVDPDSNEASDTIRVGTSPAAIAVGDGALWVADSIAASLLRVDPIARVVEPIELDGQPTGVAFTPEGVWVSMAPDLIARVDPSTRQVTFTTSVGSGPAGVAVAFGSVWVANQLDDTVTRLEPSSGRQEAVIPVGSGPVALAAAGDLLWVANEFGGTVEAIDPTGNTIERRAEVGGAAVSLAVDGEDLWLATGASPTEHLGGKLVVASTSEAFETLDPAILHDAFAWQILSITNDGLVAYKKVGGPDGATLVPDLAASLPQVSADGLTYRFPLRAGIRYSTGDPIAPEDFRRGLERALALSEDAGGLFFAIEGADACGVDPPVCDLTDSIVVDDEAVTFRLSIPDAELPFKLALPFAFPVPSAVPMEDQGLVPLPATGPYMVESAGPEGVELVRNPAFEMWSAAAQPNGFVDRISWRFGWSAADAASDLDAGRVDVMADGLPPEDIATLRATHPDRLAVWPLPSLFFVGFDVLKPPFDDARVRQAVNFAIDRDFVAEHLGGPVTPRPACQILPPTFQGYTPFCPYTADPGTGVWTKPDLERARELIQAAGAAGQEVVVSVTDAPGHMPPGAMDVMGHVVDVLNDLGLQASLAVVDDGVAYWDALYAPTSPSHPQAFLAAWVSDYPAAGNFIEPQFGCAGFANSSGFCDEQLDAAIDAALADYASGPGAANRAWVDIEHRLVEEAVQVPVANFARTLAVSARTGNVQVNPQWGILLSRIWVE